jgi:DNA polymerase lambda
VQRRELQDARAYALPLAAADEGGGAAPLAPSLSAEERRSGSPESEDEEEGAGAAPVPATGAPVPQRAAAPPFAPPPPSGDACASCGKALGWQELARCQACLSASASALERALHLRFLVTHPNAALVTALSELADYEELFGEARSADAFHRAAATLKATPADIRTSADLEACAPPFVGGKLKERYLPEFWARGTLARLEAHRAQPERVAARALARLPYVGAALASKWAAQGLRTPAEVWAAHTARTLAPPLATAWQRLSLEHADELLAEIRAEDQAPLVDAVRAAAAAVSVGGAPLQVALTGGAARGKPASHDLDFLITHPVEGAEAGKLEAMLRVLAASPAVERDDAGRPRMLVGLSADMSALAVGGKPAKQRAGKSGGWADAAPRLWSADAAGADAEEADAGRLPANKALLLVKFVGLPMRHLDLLCVPRHQHACWLLGWTGSREMERLLRAHAKQRGLKLSNTALSSADGAQLLTRDGRRVAAAEAATQYVAAGAYPRDERELWRMLGLPWRPPAERNA